MVLMTQAQRRVDQLNRKENSEADHSYVRSFIMNR